MSEARHDAAERPVRHPPPRARLDRRPRRRRAAPGRLRRRARVRYAAARGRARRLAGGLPAHRARGAHRPGRRGAGHPRAQPRGLGGEPAGRLGARRLRGPAGARGRRHPALGRGDRGAARRSCAARWPPTSRAIEADASYQELNERHLAFHVSLVGLTGSPRLVAMQENLVVELKLALAQVDRIRRNAHDQADSHAALVRLLERRRHRRGVRVPGRPPRRRPGARSSRRSSCPAACQTDSRDALPELAGHHRRRGRRRDAAHRRHLLHRADPRPGRDRATSWCRCCWSSLIFGVITSFVKPILTILSIPFIIDHARPVPARHQRRAADVHQLAGRQARHRLPRHRLLAGGRRRHRDHGGRPGSSTA